MYEPQNWCTDDPNSVDCAALEIAAQCLRSPDGSRSPHVGEASAPWESCQDMVDMTNCYGICEGDDTCEGLSQQLAQSDARGFECMEVIGEVFEVCHGIDGSMCRATQEFATCLHEDPNLLPPVPWDTCEDMVEQTGCYYHCEGDEVCEQLYTEVGDSDARGRQCVERAKDVFGPCMDGQAEGCNAAVTAAGECVGEQLEKYFGEGDRYEPRCPCYDGCAPDDFGCRYMCNEECYWNPADEWRREHGMNCYDKQHVEQRAMQAGVNRMILASTTDSASGCSDLLNGFLIFDTVQRSRKTKACVVPQRIDGAANPEWLEDPCCNDSALAFQCCAPRNLEWEERAVVGADAAHIAVYEAATGFDGAVALIAAQNFADTRAARDVSCFAALSSKIDKLSGIQRTVEKCAHDVRGEWDHESNGNVGQECKLASDCWVQNGCVHAPTRSLSGAGGSGSKRCLTPDQARGSANGDFLTPTLRCVFSQLPDELKQSFIYQLTDSAQKTKIKHAAAALREAFPDLT